MTQRPSFLLDRPISLDEPHDVLSDVLRAMRLTRIVFGRIELAAPWGIRAAGHDLFGFYVVARGGALLTAHGKPPVTLSNGDVALLPRGGEHELRDLTGRRLLPRDIAIHKCANAMREAKSRQGGDGPQTDLIGGVFRFAEPLTHPLLAGLPAVMHLRADDPAAASWLGATVQLLVNESSGARSGGSIVLERLTEVLLVHALRLHASQNRCPSIGLRALADPVIGRALRSVHDAPGNDWTVERLATAVGLSRSGFSARFHELVGEPPLRYVTRWRVTRASELLRDGNDSVATIASSLGYESEAAFHRAFKRWRGVGPGAFRRSAHALVRQ